MSDSEVLASRVLAHQLYTQCRQSPGAFKSLTPSIRSLRNLLEEVEDSTEGDVPAGANDSRLAEQVARCHAILTQVRLELQDASEAGAFQPREDRLSDLRTAIDVACHQLSVTHHTLDNTGIIHLRLDTNANLPARSLSSASASASASAASDHARKLSTSSSAWSLVNPETTSSRASTIDSRVSRELKLVPYDEKQALSPISSEGLRPRKSSIFGSTFALDPLSIPLEEATAFIMGEDESIASESAETLVRSTSGAHESTGSLRRPPTFEGSAMPDGIVFTSPTPVSRTLVADVLERTPRDDGREPQVSRSTPGEEPSPRSVLPYPTLDELSPAAVQMPDIQWEPLVPEQASIAPRPTESAPVQWPVTRSVSTPILPMPYGNLARTGEDVYSPTRISTVAPAALREPLERPPALPRRPPPPPPPSPRRSRTRAASTSRYIIVNPEPANDEASDDSEEDLYTTSRKGSPAGTHLEHVQSAPPMSPAVPEVRLNGAACTEVDEAPETVEATAAKPDSAKFTLPSGRIAREASTFNAPFAPYNAEIPGLEALNTAPPMSDTADKPPPLPRRPVRYHSMRAAPTTPAPWASPTEPKAAASSYIAAHLQPDKKHGGLRERKSIGDALNLLASKEPSTNRWSWQKRTRSRSELDHTQMPAAPPQHRRSHSHIAKLIRDDAGTAAKVRPDAKLDPPPQLLLVEFDDGPPPTAPKSRLSFQYPR
ncbi:hypothetical protein LTR53_004026 [Teratosphaeriaceae sp. CCFEE 6253]|nr:hypothetical protein LTR53_004026 [Teratosphaeriaceae sp. CCFEE 6253]